MCESLSGLYLQPFWILLLNPLVVLLLSALFNVIWSRIRGKKEGFAENYRNPNVLFVFLSVTYALAYIIFTLINLEQDGSWNRYQEFYTRLMNSGVPTIFLIWVNMLNSFSIRTIQNLPKVLEDPENAEAFLAGTMPETDSPNSGLTIAEKFNALSKPSKPLPGYLTCYGSLMYMFILPPIITHTIPMLFCYIWIFFLTAIPMCYFLCFFLCAEGEKGDSKPHWLFVLGGKYLTTVLMLFGSQVFFNYGLFWYDGIGYMDVIRKDYNLRNTACYLSNIFASVEQIWHFISLF